MCTCSGHWVQQLIVWLSRVHFKSFRRKNFKKLFGYRKNSLQAVVRWSRRNLPATMNGPPPAIWPMPKRVIPPVDRTRFSSDSSGLCRITFRRVIFTANRLIHFLNLSLNDAIEDKWGKKEDFKHATVILPEHSIRSSDWPRGLSGCRKQSNRKRPWLDFFLLLHESECVFFGRKAEKKCRKKFYRRKRSSTRKSPWVETMASRMGKTRIQ